MRPVSALIQRSRLTIVSARMRRQFVRRTTLADSGMATADEESEVARSAPYWSRRAIRRGKLQVLRQGSLL